MKKNIPQQFKRFWDCVTDEAEMLVGKTDFNIKPTNPQNNAYRCVLSSCAENSIYEVNEMLESCGFEPLGSSKLG